MNPILSCKCGKLSLHQQSFMAVNYGQIFLKNLRKTLKSHMDWHQNGLSNLPRTLACTVHFLYCRRIEQGNGIKLQFHRILRKIDHCQLNQPLQQLFKVDILVSCILRVSDNISRTSKGVNDGESDESWSGVHHKSIHCVMTTKRSSCFEVVWSIASTAHFL